MEILKKNHQLNLTENNRDGSSIDYKATINISTDEETKKTFKASVSKDYLNEIKDFKLAFIAKNTNLKGFRPGKAPLSVVWQQNQTEITNEIAKDAINKIIQTIVSELKADLVTSPKVDLKHYSLEKGLDFEITLISMPKFEAPDIKKISLDKPVYKVTEADIKEKVKVLFDTHKNFVKADAKHAAKAGDKLVIDFEGKIDGVAFEGGAAKGHAIELGSKSFIDNFEDQLLKHKAGDEVLVKVKFPEEYHEKKFAGKAAEFAVTIHEVQIASVFKDVEELAKSIGFVSSKELNEKIKETLEKECSDRAMVRVKTDLFDKLDAACKIKLPEMMVDEEFAQLWKNVEAMMKNKAAEVDKPEKELRAEYMKLAERRVKLGILLSQMAKKYDIKIEQNDLIEAVRAQAMANPASSQAIVEYYTKNPDAIETLKGPILEDKVVQCMLGEVKNVDKPIKVKELLTVSS